MANNDDNGIWWAVPHDEFMARLPREQARMKREDVGPKLRQFFDDQQYWEEVLQGLHVEDFASADGDPDGTS